MQEHYFIEKQHNNDEFFCFNEQICNENFSFESVDDIFSKNKVDIGTKIFLKALCKLNLQGDVLDIGCGYGVIGIVLAKIFSNIKINFSDVNSTAVMLTKKNIAKNNIKNAEKVILSNAFENITEKYNVIVSNPPIKAGKKVLYQILTDSKLHLKENGVLYFVIKLKFGVKTLIKNLKQCYTDVGIIYRESEFCVVEAKI